MSNSGSCTNALARPSRWALPSESVPARWSAYRVSASSSSVRVTARVAATGARLQIEPLPVVTGHASLLSLLFQNLLTNALKFVPRERVPEVKVSASTADGWATVRVQDNGIGIDPAHLGRLFQPFQRLNLKSEYEGTGLGLSIAYRIVEDHGGRFAVTSSPGRGSSFEVQFPVRIDGEHT